MHHAGRPASEVSHIFSVLIVIITFMQSLHVITSSGVVTVAVIVTMQVDIQEQPALEALHSMLQQPDAFGSLDFTFIGEWQIPTVRPCS